MENDDIEGTDWMTFSALGNFAILHLERDAYMSVVVVSTQI